ncbi:MAG TPA: hypothetical protein VEQ58_12860, partial [Polyangiaceae bacterium]|nr:hypothetical protein [Polyangiaceae bacterium]
SARRDFVVRRAFGAHENEHEIFLQEDRKIERGRREREWVVRRACGALALAGIADSLSVLGAKRAKPQMLAPDLTISL